MAKKSAKGTGRGRKLDPNKAQKVLELAKESKNKNERLKTSVIAKQAGVSAAACKRLLIQNGFSVKSKGAGKVAPIRSAPALKGIKSDYSSVWGAIATIKAQPENDRTAICKIILSK